MIDKDTGAPMLTDEERGRKPQVPTTYGDIPGYQSPVTGEWIEGRRARRYDMEKHNCVDANDIATSHGKRPGKLKNERFARKHGLERLLDD